MDPCQEDSQKDKNKNVKKNQDQTPLHILQDVIPPYHISYPPCNYNEETTSTVSLELTKNCEQSSMPILSKETCQDQRIPSCSTSPYSLQNHAQASNNSIKGVSPIKDIHESIDGLGHIAHSKDANIPIQYPLHLINLSLILICQR